MAVRPVFTTKNSGDFCDVIMTEFQFYPGFATVQKQKCVDSLHAAYLKKNPGGRVLEISRYSKEELGRKLSAFNLMYEMKDGRVRSVECCYQAAKVFAHGGPYVDILDSTSMKAKKDDRLSSSGEVIGYFFDGEDYGAVPKTFFYNWLYISALMQDYELAGALLDYDAFTDIVFNPNKGVNCQAGACATFISLVRSGLIFEAMKSKEDFLRIVYGVK